MTRAFHIVAFALAYLFVAAVTARADSPMLYVSFDVARDADAAKTAVVAFPAIRAFTEDGLLGGWAVVQKEHFAVSGIYDQIALAGKR